MIWTLSCVNSLPVLLTGVAKLTRRVLIRRRHPVRDLSLDEGSFPESHGGELVIC